MFVGNLLERLDTQNNALPDDARLIDAAKMLNQGNEIILIVNHAGTLLGVVTKTDVVRQISHCQGGACLCPVTAAMTGDVVTCTATDTLQNVSQWMKERQLKNIPVVDDCHRPIGVLTARLILRKLLGEVENEEAQLIDYVKGIGYR